MALTRIDDKRVTRQAAADARWANRRSPNGLFLEAVIA
jgi:hypothetical protein